MKKVFSTADARPADRFYSWHEVACRYLIDHDARPDCQLSFEAALSQASLEELALFCVETSPLTVVHGERHIATSDDDLLVCRQLTGVLRLEQGDRKVALGAGDMTLVDPRFCYTGRRCEGARTLVLKIPRRRLEARVGRTGEMTMRTLRVAEGENGLVSEFIALLPAHAERLGKTAGLVAEQTLDLLAVALTRVLDLSKAQLSSARFVVLMQLRSAIDKRLSDPALNPSTVAAAAGVSVRYANAVLADEQTSIARLIRTLRLERCRQGLGDPAQAHRSVSDIAYSWGFCDMTHFARRFKAAFGMLPSEYRRSQVQPFPE
jgi:AraC family transcriptional regulator, positive regulator of tynA and feaB